MLQGSRMFQKGKRCLLPFCRHGEVGLPLVWHSFFGRKASPTSRSFVRPLPSVNTWASRLCPFPLSRCPPQATLIMPGGDGRGGRKTWCHFSLSQVSHNASLSLSPFHDPVSVSVPVANKIRACLCVCRLFRAELCHHRRCRQNELLSSPCIPF